MRRHLVPALALAAVPMILLSGCSSSGSPDSDNVTISIESWRTEDIALWEDTILPAFYEAHPGITVEFVATAGENYDSTLTSKLEGGTAGDIITCRAYDDLRRNVAAGYLTPINDLSGLENFSDLSLDAWSDDEGNRYCVPMASVTAGVFYNKQIFDELGLEVPETTDELMDVLAAVKKDGTYQGIAQGTSLAWDLSYLLLSNLGQNYYGGEAFRQGLIDGTAKTTDPEFVAALEMIDDLQPYFLDNYESLTIDDARMAFVLGQAAIYVSGSYEISSLSDAAFDIGVFAPPVENEGDEVWVQDHPDIAVGMNADTKHPEEVETFLNWVATPEFADLYVNALPGFLSMQTEPVALDNELAQQFADLRDNSNTSPRLGLDRLSAGQPTFELEIMRLMQLMLNGDDTTPEQVADELQTGLEQWYPPQQG